MYKVKKTVSLMYSVMESCGVKEMDYKRLLKLLYFCDRQMYNLKNQFITGDIYLSKATGPVLSITESLIRDCMLEQCSNEYFQRYLKTTKSGNIQIIKKGENIDELSNQECRVVAEISELLGDLSFEELSEVSHLVCGEWEDPTQSDDGYASQITEYDIKVALGKL